VGLGRIPWFRSHSTTPAGSEAGSVSEARSTDPVEGPIGAAARTESGESRAAAVTASHAGMARSTTTGEAG